MLRLGAFLKDANGGAFVTCNPQGSWRSRQRSCAEKTGGWHKSHQRMTASWSKWILYEGVFVYYRCNHTQHFCRSHWATSQKGLKWKYWWNTLGCSINTRCTTEKSAAQNMAITNYWDSTKAVLGCRSCATLLEVRGWVAAGSTWRSQCAAFTFVGQVEQLMLREWCGVAFWGLEREKKKKGKESSGNWSQTPSPRRPGDPSARILNHWHI